MVMCTLALTTLTYKKHSPASLQYQRSFWTPVQRAVEPSAITFGDLITVSGDFFASSFNDTDGDSEGQDVYTRILVGGKICNPNMDDGTA